MPGRSKGRADGSGGWHGRAKVWSFRAENVTKVYNRKVQANDGWMAAAEAGLQGQLRCGVRHWLRNYSARREFAGLRMHLPLLTV